MATFEEHINQARWNLTFLGETNLKSQHYWDWQVTICFYVAVHLVNAHLAKCANLHYRTHEDVKNAINPHNPLSICKVDIGIYLSYAKIEGLSRRARYLCHDDSKNFSQESHFTHDKHFAKAIRKLDTIISYFAKRYQVNFTPISIACTDLSNNDNLKNFSLQNAG